MTDWPDPKADAVGEVLKALCSASSLDMPLPKLLEETKLTSDELDEAVKRLVAYGLADLNEGWVRLSRSSILASLRHELRL
jgi:hypothetical protein